MAHYTTPRPAPQAKQRPLTEEEKKARIMQFLQQKREQFSINILCSLCQGVSSARAVVKADLHSTTIGIDTTGLVDDAVKMADELLEKLYPIKEEESKEEKPVETDFD